MWPSLRVVSESLRTAKMAVHSQEKRIEDSVCFLCLDRKMLDSWKNVYIRLLTTKGSGLLQSCPVLK